jgi:hypothetical protein
VIYGLVTRQRKASVRAPPIMTDSEWVISLVISSGGKS